MRRPVLPERAAPRQIKISEKFPKPFPQSVSALHQTSRNSPFRIMKTRTRLISVLLLLGVIAIVAGATAFKSPDVESCNDRLARLDDATTAWATENGASFAHRPSPANLRLKSPPVCPEGGAYTLGTSFRATTCSLHDIASIPAPKPSATEKAW